MPSMSVGLFSLLLILAGLLFVGGAMVLPSGEAEYPTDLAHYFSTDGSWGAGAIALFNISAVVANVSLFHDPVTDPVNLLNLGLGVIAALVAVLRNRFWLVLLTLAYVVLLIIETIAATPVVYESIGG